MLIRKLFTCIFIFVLSFCCAQNYRILGVFPVPDRSHFFLGDTLMKALAEAGHDVTMIAPFKSDELPSFSKNGSYREIVLEGLEESQRKSEYGIFPE